MVCFHFLVQCQLTWVTQDQCGICVLSQDLKEKKLVEEKENGKDAATNGKVGPLDVCSMLNL